MLHSEESDLLLQNGITVFEETDLTDLQSFHDEEHSSVEATERWTHTLVVEHDDGESTAASASALPQRSASCIEDIDDLAARVLPSAFLSDGRGSQSGTAFRLEPERAIEFSSRKTEGNDAFTVRVTFIDVHQTEKQEPMHDGDLVAALDLFTGPDTITGFLSAPWSWLYFRGVYPSEDILQLPAPQFVLLQQNILNSLQCKHRRREEAAVQAVNQVLDERPAIEAVCGSDTYFDGDDRHDISLGRHNSGDSDTVDGDMFSLGGRRVQSDPRFQHRAISDIDELSCVLASAEDMDGNTRQNVLSEACERVCRGTAVQLASPAAWVDIWAKAQVHRPQTLPANCEVDVDAVDTAAAGTGSARSITKSPGVLVWEPSLQPADDIGVLAVRQKKSGRTGNFLHLCLLLFL